MADLAEERKCRKYCYLERDFVFSPVAIETLGVIGSSSLNFLKDLGRRVRRVTEDPLSYIYLLRRLAVAVQRGNAASVLGTLSFE